MEPYKIIKNLTDHEGYKGQDVTIFEQLPDGLLEVTDINGNIWTVSEDELQAISI